MKRLLCCILCMVLVAGCASSKEKNESRIPEFKSTVSDIISNVINPTLEKNEEFKLLDYKIYEKQGLYSNGEAYIQTTYAYGDGGEISFFISETSGNLQRISVSTNSLLANKSVGEFLGNINFSILKFLEPDLGYQMYQNVTPDLTSVAKNDYGDNSSVYCFVELGIANFVYIPK